MCISILLHVRAIGGSFRNSYDPLGEYFATGNMTIRNGGEVLLQGERSNVTLGARDGSTGNLDIRDDIPVVGGVSGRSGPMSL